MILSRLCRSSATGPTARRTKKMIKFRNLRADEIEVRIGQNFNNGKVSLLLYQDARCGLNILDETVGAENWSCNYSRQGDTLFCSIGIFVREHNSFVFKSDAGDESNIEKVKGESSDAFKRACVRWGIGRELYSAPKIIVESDNKYERFSVSEIGYDSKDRISTLSIVDSKGTEVYRLEDGVRQKIKDIDPVEVLTAVCSELKEEGENYKELGKFFNYYREKIANFDSVNVYVIKKLWTKWKH